MATWELELQEAMRVFGFCKEGCVCLKKKGVGLEPKKPVLGSARWTESQGSVGSINRSGQKEGSLVPSKMLATNRSLVAFASSHASRDETPAELRMRLRGKSAHLAHSRPRVPFPALQTKPGKEPSLWRRGAPGACTGTVPWQRKKNQARGPREAGMLLPLGRTGLRACPAASCIHPLIASCSLLCKMGT